MAKSSARLKPSKKKFAVVVARFNDFITRRLLKACLQELVHQGIKNDAITTVWVPGSFELPVVAKKLALKKNILMVSAKSASYKPSIVGVYQYNSSSNQWPWVYTLSNDNSSFGSSLATDGETIEMIGSPRAKKGTTRAPATSPLLEFKRASSAINSPRK